MQITAFTSRTRVINKALGRRKIDVEREAVLGDRGGHASETLLVALVRSGIGGGAIARARSVNGTRS